MIESSSSTRWMSVARASRVLGITETAVRKRISTGAIQSRGRRGSTEVLIGVEDDAQEVLQPVHEEVRPDTGPEVMRLTIELAELRMRLADALQDRDRWHAAATEARDEARAERTAREAIERELRIVLSRP